MKPMLRRKNQYCKGCGDYTGYAGAGKESVCWQCDKAYQKAAYQKAATMILPEEKEKMTPDKLYELGYRDGRAGKSMAAAHMTDSNYKMGYEDGKGDRHMERPVGDEYTVSNDAPEGFEYIGEKRVPFAWEFYLSKGGKATFLPRARKNNQERHILRCTYCGKQDAEQCYDHPEVKGSK